jgi:broad specificity phosphatase PhoE
MAFAIYNIGLAAVSVALLFMWFVQPGWRGVELFALFALASPLYAPLLYRLATRLWVAQRRRQLGLPAASDRDLIDLVGEELDRAAIDWHWRLAWRGPGGNEIEIGDEDADDLRVRVQKGVLTVGDTANGTTRFIDPVAALDHAIALHDGPARTVIAIFADEEA